MVRVLRGAGYGQGRSERECDQATFAHVIYQRAEA
jgi:hypothetical protein